MKQPKLELEPATHLGSGCRTEPHVGSDVCFESFCSDIIQTVKYFALESFKLSCQAQHTKINSR